MTRFGLNKGYSFNVCVVITLITLSFSVNSNYLADKEAPGGWHYYEPEEVEEEPEPPKPTPTQSSSTPSSAPLSAEWLRENFPKFLDAAIDNPTPENIKRTRYVNRLMIDKSSAFTDAWMLDALSNPYLDESIVRPVNAAGLAAKAEMVYQNQDKTLQKVAEKAGIWFFYQSDCPYCNRQAPTMLRFRNMGFDVIAISLDGGQLKSGLFPDYVVDYHGKALELQVTNVPAMFLVGMDGQSYLPLGQSLKSQSELVSTIFKHSLNNGFITKRDYDEASAVGTLPRANLIGLDPDRSVNDPEYLYKAIEDNIKQQMEPGW